MTLQQRLKIPTCHTGQFPQSAWRSRNACIADTPSYWLIPHVPRPGFVWLAAPSRSDSVYPLKVFNRPNRLTLNTPLKPSLKFASKPIISTESESMANLDAASQYRPLQHVKAVEFKDGTGTEKRRLPPLNLWSTSPAFGKSRRAGIPEEQGYQNSKRNASRRAFSCPDPVLKSSAACPALTKTDVQVAASVPSWSFEAIVDKRGIDPSNLTVQIVESENGYYETIWDNAPIDDFLKIRRKASCTNLVSHVPCPGTAKGLEQVNSKLSQ